VSDPDAMSTPPRRPVEPNPPLEPADFSPRRPFTQVVQSLRDADVDGRLDEACQLLVQAYRPVLHRVAFQLMRGRDLDPATWGWRARTMVEDVVLDELPAIIRSGAPIADLTMVLAPALRRARTQHLVDDHQPRSRVGVGCGHATA
jgi:hypothetical protein